MEIDLISGWRPVGTFGMLRYQEEIRKRIEDVKWNIIEYNSLPRVAGKVLRAFLSPESKSRSTSSSVASEGAMLKIGKFLNIPAKCVDVMDKYRYAFLVKRKVKKGNIKHITNQGFAYLLKSLKLEKTIVTCHDLAPYIFSKDFSFFEKLNQEGLKKADRIITVSEFSKNVIIKLTGYPEEKINVIHNGVDLERYAPMPNTKADSIIEKYGLPRQRYILYVGSNDPRKNLPILIKAFRELKEDIKDVKLVKVGRLTAGSESTKLIKLIKELGVEKEIIVTDQISEEDLPKLYNLADLFIFPSLYEGFGLPPLEAMACGTPVITSNTSSLPEVVGDAGFMIDPNAVNGLANAMYEVLNNDGLREDMIKKGLERAKMFSWEKAAKETLKVYEEIS